MGQPGQMLVLHADDFGMNPEVNRGVLLGFSQGLLTSTSVLANSPACADALSQWSVLEADRRAGALPSQAARASLGDPPRAFDLGVHLNLTQGRPLRRGFPDELLDRDGRFPGVFHLFFRLRNRSDRYRERLRAELAEQISLVCDYGVTPTHVNGHQYIELFPAISQLLPELLARFGVRCCRLARESQTRLPWRPWKWANKFLACVKHHFATEFSRTLAMAGVPHPDRFHGASHAGRIDLPTISRFLDRQASGLTEIALHPGLPAAVGIAPQAWADPLASLRPGELAMVTSPGLFLLLCARKMNLARLARQVPARPRGTEPVDVSAIEELTRARNPLA